MSVQAADFSCGLDNMRARGTGEWFPGNEGAELIDTVAEFLVKCPHEKEQGYRAEQVLSPCQPACAPCVLP